MRYFFILGKNPGLSVAEILSLLKRQKVEYGLITVSSQFLILETEKPFSEDEFLDKLGGTIKIGKILDQNNIELETLLKIIPQDKFGKKINFGFSVYGEDKKEVSKINNQIKKLAISIKNNLKNRNISSRWVTSKKEILSSVIVKKNKLLDQGREIIVLLNQEELYLGFTQAVQEFEEYGKRDYGKPRRDILSGMLPPKLAKIMINLAEVDIKGNILDPFCGTGTVIGEALLLGYKNLICSDIKKEAIDNAKENNKWLMEYKTNKILKGAIDYYNADVKNLDKFIKKRKVESIITEPYLGPLIKGNETSQKIESIIHDLSKLYLESFKVFKKILINNGSVVFVFPVFSLNNKNLFIPILEKIEKLGFKRETLLQKEFNNLSFLDWTPRKTLLYFRPGQRVKREIIRFHFQFVK